MQFFRTFPKKNFRKAQCQELIRNLDGFSDISAGKTSTECRKSLIQCAKRINISDFFSNKTSQKDPMHTSKAVFTTLPKKFCQKVESFSLISQKDKNIYNFFKKLNFLQGFHVDKLISVSTILFELFWQEAENVCSINKTDKKNNFFKKTSVKMFFGTRRIDFSQPKIFFSLCKKNREFFFSKKLLKKYL